MATKLMAAANDATAAERCNGKFDISLYTPSGETAFVGTVALQRMRTTANATDAEWRTIKTYTGPVEEMGEGAGSWSYRLICTAYTSGKIYAEVSD